MYFPASNLSPSRQRNKDGLTPGENIAKSPCSKIFNSLSNLNIEINWSNTLRAVALIDPLSSDELCLYSRYHVRNGGGVLPRRHHSRAGRISVWLLLHVTSLSEFDNEDRFLNSAITSTLNLALNLVRAFFLFFHLCPEVGGQGSERSSDAIDDPTRTWTLAARTSGNRK